MIEGKPLVIPGTTCFTVDSKHVGDQFEIRVFQPLPFPPAAIDAGLRLPDAFRVIYTLDANLGFASFVANTTILPGDPDGGPVEYLIVVGIGYPLDDEDTSKVAVLRSRDMTPPGTPEPPEMEMFKQMAGGLDVGFGQADNFLRFLEDELDPLIRREFPCRPDKAGLFGFSYGGLFALYALFSRSPMFDRYIIGSPGSVVEGDPILEYEERCWAQGPELNARGVYHAGLDGTNLRSFRSSAFGSQLRQACRQTRRTQLPGTRMERTGVRERVAHVLRKSRLQPRSSATVPGGTFSHDERRSEIA